MFSQSEENTDYEIQTKPLLINSSNMSIETLNSQFYRVHKGWGVGNGGVRMENVFYDQQQQLIRITACGDQYRGNLKGINNKGQQNQINKRIGGCIVTRKYFPPGSFRYLMKLPTQTGLCTALWTFHYQQAYPHQLLYQELLDEGLSTSGNTQKGKYIVRNHEIDIQLPTANTSNHNLEEVDYSSLKVTSWRGELENEHHSKSIDLQTHLNDGKFHQFRFDWFTSTKEHESKVQFYIDSCLIYRCRQNVPDIAGRVHAGLWFPSVPENKWAGKEAGFEHQELLIKQISIIPDNNCPYRFKPQTYGNIGLKQLR